MNHLPLLNPPSPLDVQELLNHTISFLTPSAADLISCALRRAHLFRVPHDRTLGPDYNTFPFIAVSLCQALTENPTLAQHVREFRLCLPGHVDTALPELLHRIQFTNLRTLDIVYMRTDSAPFPESFARLLTLRSLRQLKMHFDVPPSPSLMRVMQSSSRTIQHLDLVCSQGLGDPLNCRMEDGPHPTTLKSLSPFGLSELKALAIRGADIAPWGLIETRNIRVLEITHVPSNSKKMTPVDLSQLSNLSILRINFLLIVPTTIFKTLATMVSSHRIHTIFVYFESDMKWEPWKEDEYEDESSAWEKLDQVLSSVPLDPLPTVEVEFDADEKKVESFFPRLVAKQMLRIIPFAGYKGQLSWWQNAITRL
ncbi:hypothetical protein R3P38DRAFT_3157125 [Favolaschia claudopus]|uniref:F-box domain-containing protein n=1 Tax=Favolaschia claudopus TaxID=2862362 RepID=A0AAV9YYA0_9AGAR